MLHAWLASFEQTCVFYGGWWVTPLLFLLGQIDRSYFFICFCIHTYKSIDDLVRERDTDRHRDGISRTNNFTNSPSMLFSHFGCLFAGWNSAAQPSSKPNHYTSTPHTHDLAIFYVSDRTYMLTGVSLCLFSLRHTHTWLRWWENQQPLNNFKMVLHWSNSHNILDIGIMVLDSDIHKGVDVVI